MERMLRRLSTIACSHARVIVVIAALVALITGIFAAATLTLNANLDDLVSEELDYHKRYIEFLEEFGDEEYLYVVVDAGEDLPKAKRFVETLGERLKGVPDLKEVLWKIDNPALEKNFLLYMTEEQLEGLSAMTARGPFAVGNIAQWRGFSPLVGALAGRIAEPVSTEDEAELSQGFTFIDTLLGDMTAALGGERAYESRLQALFFGDGDTFDTDGFLKNGDLLFLLIMPDKDFSTLEVIAKPLEEIRRAIAETKGQFPGIDAGLTGRPVLAADEIMTSDRDMTRATIIAIILVGIIFILFFRSISRPLLAMASLVMGIAWTFGFVALLYGELNLLSIVFAIILVGAAIEYAIHIVARYQEELALDGDVSRAISVALSTAGRSDLTSALTTAAAFLTITWTDFSALAQLGVIAAAGILFCLIAMLLVLPAMLSLRDRRRSAQELKGVRPFTMPRLGALYRRPGWLFAGAALLTIVVVPFATRTGFDNNLLNLQAEGLESVRYENLILEKSSETTWFARAVADTAEESKRLAEAFKKLPSVRRVDDVERILPVDQAAKAAKVERMAPAFEDLSFQPASTTVDAQGLKSALGRLIAGIEKLEAQAFTGGRIDAVEELERFLTKAVQLRDAIEKATPEGLARLGRFQRDFFDDLHRHLEILATGMQPTALTLGDLPPELVSRYVSPRGRYGLMIYPKENIWDPVALKTFIDDIRSVDAQALGTPIEVYESGKLMRETFLRSAVLAFFVICILVWIDFRSWRGVILAVAPLVIGTAWLVGFMGIFSIPFNMANFFAIPILIGIGVDFGVHMTHRLLRDRSFSACSSSTGKGVVLTAIANAIGFGAMMIAQHRGIASLGQIMAIGCVMILAATLIAMPPVARWLLWRRDS